MVCIALEEGELMTPTSVYPQFQLRTWLLIAQMTWKKRMTGRNHSHNEVAYLNLNWHKGEELQGLVALHPLKTKPHISLESISHKKFKSNFNTI